MFMLALRSGEPVGISVEVHWRSEEERRYCEAQHQRVPLLHMDFDHLGTLDKSNHRNTKGYLVKCAWMGDGYSPSHNHMTRLPYECPVRYHVETFAIICLLLRNMFRIIKMDVVQHKFDAEVGLKDAVASWDLDWVLKQLNIPNIDAVLLEPWRYWHQGSRRADAPRVPWRG